VVAQLSRVGGIERGSVNRFECRENASDFGIRAAEGTQHQKLIGGFGEDDPLPITGFNNVSWGKCHVSQ
jgi:hypothetical protein